MVGDLGEVDAASDATAPLWVRIVINLIGAATVIGATILLFRSPTYTRTLDAADEARVRTLLREFGSEDSLGYFATRRDKAVVWETGDAATARAGVSYRVVGSVSLASGNPVGDPLHWPAAIEEWRRQARLNGWSLAVMGAGTTGALAYTDAGLTAWEIGDEAILDMRTFSLTGPGMKAVRQSVTRLQRKGYTTRVSKHGSLDAAQFAALDAAAAQWRGDGGDERGFSMALGRLGDQLDADCVLVEAHDGDGQLRAFLSFVPWGRTGVSLDLMRRDPTADNGLVELMVASLAERATAFGAGRVSLNFAMFREAFERGAEVGAGPIARLWRQSLVLASRNWQLESLYRSNAKYQPEWQPRFICFEYTSDLPRVGTAAGSAEGFLTRPSLKLLNRREARRPTRWTARGTDYAARGRGADPGGAVTRSRRRCPRTGCPSSSASVARRRTGCAPAASTRTRSRTRGPTRSRPSAPRPATSRRTPRPDGRSRWWGGSSVSGTAASSGSGRCATAAATSRSWWARTS